MFALVDLIYGLLAVMLAPIWLTRMIRTGKHRTDWRGRFGVIEPLPPAERQRVLLHAVSVGEVNAIRLLVDRLKGTVDVVVAATTDTGFTRASELFGEQHHVVRYPFDFSICVRRFLSAVRPDVVVLVELEVWPNFVSECQRIGVPVCIVNGRLTERSFRRYRLIGRLVRPTFLRLDRVAVQTQEYADRMIALGVRPGCITVTGTMKWDTAEVTDHVPGAEELAQRLGIERSRPLIVAGSTAPGEHELLMRAVPDGAQLLCAPRRPEWFDEAAHAMEGCIRWSRPHTTISNGRFLLDTIGQLRKAYALADVVVVGRTFGTLHGSDMMEPVALGKATVIGPAVDDFQQTVDALLAGDGVIQTTAEDLALVLRRLLADDRRRRELAANGRRVILSHQGATERNAEIILNLLTAGALTPADERTPS